MVATISAVAFACLCGGCRGDATRKVSTNAPSAAAVDPAKNPEIPKEHREQLEQQRAEEASRSAEYDRQKN